MAIGASVLSDSARALDVLVFAKAAAVSLTPGENADPKLRAIYRNQEDWQTRWIGPTLTRSQRKVRINMGHTTFGSATMFTSWLRADVDHR